MTHEPSKLAIATRRSPLALWQAEHVAARLRTAHPGLEVTLVALSTRGDRILDRPLAKVGGKGLFMKELEEALLDGRADLAVHSMKDVPAEMPEGFQLPAILDRGSPFDAFVSNHYQRLADLPEGARVGTSSLRRQCQLLARRPDLRIDFLRGNVGTRLGRLDRDEFDAIVLAAAGLQRLELSERIRCELTPEECLPAVGQGALGIECRAGDDGVATLVRALNDDPTETCLRAERAFGARLGASCETPLGAYATLSGAELTLRGLVGAPDGRTVVNESITGAAEDAAALGTALAERLLARGADRLLAEARAEPPASG